MLAFGMAIALVEKGNDYPVRPWRIGLQLVLRKLFGRKWSRVVKCTVCASMWTALVADCVLCLVNLILFGTFYFFWPFTGLITLGVTFVIIEFLNAIDKEQNINIFVEDKEGEK